MRKINVWRKKGNGKHKRKKSKNVVTIRAKRIFLGNKLNKNRVVYLTGAAASTAAVKSDALYTRLEKKRMRIRIR